MVFGFFFCEEYFIGLTIMVQIYLEHNNRIDNIETDQYMRTLDMELKY